MMFVPLLMVFVSCQNNVNKLDKPEKIQGIPCSEYASRYENGKLKETILGENDTLNGNYLPRGTRICLTEDGSLQWCFLRDDLMIQGLPCKGEGVGEWQISFYPNGKLQTVWLARPTEIQGVTAMEASFWNDKAGGVEVLLYDNGNLRQCKVAKTCIIQGVKVKRGDHVQFKPDGKLVNVSN